jgi:hypothetical protein
MFYSGVSAENLYGTCIGYGSQPDNATDEDLDDAMTSTETDLQLLSSASDYSSECSDDAFGDDDEEESAKTPQTNPFPSVSGYGEADSSFYLALPDGYGAPSAASTLTAPPSSSSSSSSSSTASTSSVALPIPPRNIVHSPPPTDTPPQPPTSSLYSAFSDEEQPASNSTSTAPAPAPPGRTPTAEPPRRRGTSRRNTNRKSRTHIPNSIFPGGARLAWKAAQKPSDDPLKRASAWGSRASLGSINVRVKQPNESAISETNGVTAEQVSSAIASAMEVVAPKNPVLLTRDWNADFQEILDIPSMYCCDVQRCSELSSLSATERY